MIYDSNHLLFFSWQFIFAVNKIFWVWLGTGWFMCFCPCILVICYSFGLSIHIHTYFAQNMHPSSLELYKCTHFSSYTKLELYEHNVSTCFSFSALSMLLSLLLLLLFYNFLFASFLSKSSIYRVCASILCLYVRITIIFHFNKPVEVKE